MTKQEILIIIIIGLSSLVFIGFFALGYRLEMRFHPYHSQQERWCVENGGQFFPGGFGADDCKFTPNK